MQLSCNLGDCGIGRLFVALYVYGDISLVKCKKQVDRGRCGG